MNIPSLTVLCSQKIVSDESLFSLRETPPLAEKKVIEKTAIICKWKWFATPSADKNTQFKFNLTPRNYEDFHTLCPTYRVKKPEFLLYSGQEQHDYHTVSKIIKFVREKGRITATQGGLSFSLNYHIPTSDRVNSNHFGTFVKIAEIKLPRKEHQTVEVCIKPLSKINKAVISKWNQKTYNRVRDFAIYYVNQLAIDNPDSNKYYFFCNSTRTDNRLYLAQNSEDITETIKHLFGDYTGPSHWLLNCE